jgi:hypothetical protein
MKRHRLCQNYVSSGISVFVPSAVYRIFQSRSTQTKDYKISICLTRTSLKKNQQTWATLTYILFSVLPSSYGIIIFYELKKQTKKQTKTRRYFFHRLCQSYVSSGISVFVPSVVDRVFQSRSTQTKDYKIGMCCFSDKHAELRRKSKDSKTNAFNCPYHERLKGRIHKLKGYSKFKVQRSTSPTASRIH